MIRKKAICTYKNSGLKRGKKISHKREEIGNRDKILFFYFIVSIIFILNFLTHAGLSFRMFTMPNNKNNF